MEYARGIINNYFSVAGAQAISAPLSLLYLSLITRLMGPVNYGKFALFLASFQFFYTLLLNWMRNATIRFGSEEFTIGNKLNKIFSAQILVFLITLSFTLIVVFILRHRIAYFTGLAPNIYIYVMLFMVSYAFFDFICQLLQASHHMPRYALSLITRQCIILGLVVLIYRFEIGLNPAHLISIEMLSYYSVILFSISPLFKGRYLEPVVFEKKIFKDILRYSWPIMILCGLGYFSLWADTVLIRLFLNFESVGRYEAANRLMQYILNLLLPISIIAFPVAVSIKSKGRDDLIHKYAQRIIPQASFFWGLFITILMFGAGGIFRVIFGNQYTGSVLIFRMLLAGLAFQFLAIMYTAILQSYDFNRELVYILLIAVIINLSGNLLLIPKIGIIGAASSKSLSFMASGLLYMYRSIKCVSLKGDSYKNSILFLTFPLLLLPTFYLTDSPLLICLFTLTCIIIPFLFAKRIKLFTKEDGDLIKELNMPGYLKLAIVKTYKILY